jgi:hypothetical protein
LDRLPANIIPDVRGMPWKITSKVFALNNLAGNILLMSSEEYLLKPL